MTSRRFLKIKHFLCIVTILLLVLSYTRFGHLIMARLYSDDNTCTVIQKRNKTQTCKDIKQARAFCTEKTTMHFPLLDDYCLNNPKTETSTSRSLPVIVTGADYSHYLETQGCIKSLHKNLRPNYADFKLIYYDLGLKSRQKEQLQKYCGCEVRSFPYNRYPRHVRQLGMYAFKPIIISSVMQQYESVWWMDASIRVTDGNISKALQKLNTDGVVFFAGDVPGSPVWRTSPLMFKFFNVTPSYYLRYPEIMALNVMFKSCLLTEFILKIWTSCALVKDCISPSDANLNCPDISHTVITADVGRCHRYDQSLLNILLWNIFPDVESGQVPHQWLTIAKEDKERYFPDH